MINRGSGEGRCPPRLWKTAPGSGASMTTSASLGLAQSSPIGRADWCEGSAAFDACETQVRFGSPQRADRSTLGHVCGGTADALGLQEALISIDGPATPRSPSHLTPLTGVNLIVPL